MARRGAPRIQQHLDRGGRPTTLDPFAGGLVGILLGVAIPLSVGLFADIQIPISALAIVVAFGVSCLVGLVFGILPANRAAHLNPTEALRYE